MQRTKNFDNLSQFDLCASVNDKTVSSETATGNSSSAAINTKVFELVEVTQVKPMAFVELGTGLNLRDSHSYNRLNFDNGWDAEDICLEAIENTRDKLKTPINITTGLRSYSSKYRNNSPNWLLLRAQRSVHSPERTALSNHYKMMIGKSKKEISKFIQSQSQIPANKKFNESNFGLIDELDVAYSAISDIENSEDLPMRNRQDLIQEQYNGFLRQQLNRINDFEVGNCYEFALYTADQLVKLGKKNVMVLSLLPEANKRSLLGASGHCIAVCDIQNHKPSSKDQEFIARKPSWGEDFQIIDSWSKDTYRYSDLLKNNCCSSLSLLQRITRNAVLNYLTQGRVSIAYSNIEFESTQMQS